MAEALARQQQLKTDATKMAMKILTLDADVPKRCRMSPNIARSRMKENRMQLLLHSLQHRKRKLTRIPSDKCWISLLKLSFSRE
jgi:hypothetical protein